MSVFDTVTVFPYKEGPGEIAPEPSKSGRIYGELVELARLAGFKSTIRL
jgi:hypothetical protein